MPSNQTPDLPGFTILAEALLTDVRYVHDHGLELLIEPDAIPALAELAEAANANKYKGEAEYFGGVIEELLRDALPRVPRLLHVSRQGFCQGMEELFGIGQLEWTTQADRRNNAAGYLGYKNGESLRKGEREEGVAWELYLEYITDQLIALASEIGFAYAGRFVISVAPQSGATGTLISRKLDHSELVAARPLSHILIRELRDLYREGFQAADDQALVPTLNKLAEAVIDRPGSTMEKMVVLLRWAINEAESDDGRREGIEDLLGVGRVPGQELERRRDRAAPNLGERRAGMLPRHHVEAAVLVNMKNTLLPLAIDVGLLASEQ